MQTSKVVSQRAWFAVVVVVVGIVAAYGAFALARLPEGDATRWALFLQNTVNLIRLVEVGALGFTAYQFWIGRTERRLADEAAAIRARKDANYQAWQVINSAQGKGGSGGRVDALADLVRNDVSLAGINLDGAWLESIDLRGAQLPLASFERANLQGARLDGARLDGVSFRDANLVAVTLVGASLRRADLTGARLSAANLALADLTEVRGWQDIVTIAHADVEGVRGAPRGFAEWARVNGAVDAAVEDHRLSHPEQAREFRIV